METIGRSTLFNKICTLVGFGYGTNLHKAGFINFTFYKTNTEWIICISEGAGKFDVELQRKGLGGKIKGELIAPFAHRSCDIKLPFEKLKEFAEEINVFDIKFEWINEV